MNTEEPKQESATKEPARSSWWNKGDLVGKRSIFDQSPPPGFISKSTYAAIHGGVIGFILTFVVLQLHFWLAPMQVDYVRHSPGSPYYDGMHYVVYYGSIPEVLRKQDFLASKEPLIKSSKRDEITKWEVGLSSRKLAIDFYMSLLAIIPGALLGVLISWRKMLARFTRSAKGVVRNIDSKLDELNK